MKRKLKERTLDTTYVLDQRYNKALVCSQLKAIFAYADDKELYADQDKVMNAWEASSRVVGDRPRFFNIKPVFNLEQDMMVLTSSYSSYWEDAHEYNIFTITFRGYVNFGLPVNRHLVDVMGGANYVSRLICSGGLGAVMQALEELTDKLPDYKDKDRVKNNLQILTQFKGAILGQ